MPSLLRVLLDSFADLQQRLPELRMWVTSGEEIPVELAKRFREAMPQARADQSVWFLGGVRRCDLLRDWQATAGAAGSDRAADRQHAGLYCWMMRCSRCRSGCMASFMSGGRGWRGAISIGRI